MAGAFQRGGVAPRADAAAAILPFAVWMALMLALPATAGAYAVRSSATLLVALGFSLPWLLRGRTADSRQPTAEQPDSPARALLHGILGGAAAGVLVAVLWIAPERWAWYREWLVAGGDAGATGRSPFEPAVCGWPLTVAKLAGSAFVIAPVEELFFRSYLYRRLVSSDWRGVGLRRFDLSAFLWSSALFALEHDRWAAGFAAGAVYCLAFVRWGFLPAAVAHSLTNLLLGAWVVFRGDWAFW